MLKISGKILTLYMLLFAVAMGHWSCRKDILELRPYPVTSTELKLFLNQVPDPSTEASFNFNGLSQDMTLTTQSGLRIFLTDVDHLFETQGNNPVAVSLSSCTDLSIEVTVANKRGDIISRGLSTVSTDNQLLESIGMVEVKVYCGGSELQLLPGRSLKVQLPSSVNTDNLTVFAATYDADDNFTGWEDSGQEIFKADWQAPNGIDVIQGYEILISRLGWANCAKKLGSSTTSSFCANLQAGYTGLNTQAYLVFENSLTIVPLTFDDISLSFCFPNIPSGYPVRIISVAKLDGTYWLGSVATETGTNSIQQVQPVEKEAQEILGYLRGL